MPSPSSERARNRIRLTITTGPCCSSFSSPLTFNRSTPMNLLPIAQRQFRHDTKDIVALQVQGLSFGVESGTTCSASIMTHPAPTPPARDPVGWLNNQPYLLLSLTSLFWAGNIVLARHVGDHVPPMTLTTHPLVRRLPDPAAVRASAPEARLAGAARPSAAAAVPVGDRICLQQRASPTGRCNTPRR